MIKIVGLGDNVVDRYLNLHVMFPGGNAVNVAAHGAKQGVESAYFGRIADDEEGHMILSSLADLHVDTSHCEVVAHGTTKRCDVNVYDGERSFVEVDLGKAWPGGVDIQAEALAYLQTFDLIHSSCNAKMPEQMKKIKDCHGLVSFDFGEKVKYRDDTYLDMICPYIDLALFSCDHLSLDDIQKLAKRIYDKGVSLVLLTRGTEGPLAFNGTVYVQGIVEVVTPVDTMGAGDSFLAAFIVSLLKQGWTKQQNPSEVMILEAMHQGAKYAASNCLITGGFGYQHPF